MCIFESVENAHDKMDATIGIRVSDDVGYVTLRILLLKESTCRVWSTVVDQVLNEKKL